MTSELPLEAIAPLDRNHDVAGFDCGQPSLNEYLQKYALTNQQNRSGRRYVVARGRGVVGYYTLVAGSVEPNAEPSLSCQPPKRSACKPSLPITQPLARKTAPRSSGGSGTFPLLTLTTLMGAGGSKSVSSEFALGGHRRRYELALDALSRRRAS